MAIKQRIIKEKISHSGLWDFKSFYKYLHSWLKDESYGVIEKQYSEKVSGNTREIEIEWDATKELSDYFRIEISIEISISDLVDVEVEIDGKKKKMNKGKISAEITGDLVMDPESKWEGSPFNRFLRETYNKYLIPSRIESMSYILASDVRKFKEEMKSFLELLGRR